MRKTSFGGHHLMISYDTEEQLAALLHFFRHHERIQLFGLDEVDEAEIWDYWEGQAVRLGKDSIWVDARYALTLRALDTVTSMLSA